MSNNNPARVEYDPDDIVVHTIDEVGTARAPSPRILAPWGNNIAVGERHRTWYPPHFPRIIKRLISLIPYQEGPIGGNIRPVVVDLIRTAISPTTLEEIATLLSSAPTHLLQDMAHAIADVVRACWEGPENSSTLFSSLVPVGFMMQLSEWALQLRDDQFPGRMAGVITGPRLQHTLLDHAFVIARPSNGMRMFLAVESCPYGLAPSLFGSMEEIQSYISSLPAASAEEVAADDTCHICFEKYGHPTPTEGPEHPLRLPCGHIFGNACLIKLLAIDSQLELTNSACPLCRATLEVFDLEVPELLTSIDGGITWT